MMPNRRPVDRVPGCDAPEPAPVYALTNRRTGEVTYFCRCIVCAHCGHHTGNANQGHYWAWCTVSRQTEDFHFCCPGKCEINASAS